MVMPRSRSRSLESITRSATCSLARNVPDWRSMASTRVVLPWSTWAMMAILRIVWVTGELFLLLAWPMGYGLGDNTVIRDQKARLALSAPRQSQHSAAISILSAVGNTGFRGGRRVEPSESDAGSPRYTGLAC